MPSVTIDVELDDFDSDDLKEELERRGFIVRGTGTSAPTDSTPSDLIERLYYALANSDQDTINRTATTICYVMGGRIL
ncbi:MAG: hypothetical protein ACRDDA_00585 [Aeromonas sp.]